jgi:3-deoxy-D-manno-octulosonic-acid transferase
MRTLYTFAWRLALPFVRLRLWWRGQKEPGYHAFLHERFAKRLRSREGPLIWLHAVSVGETRAASPLIKALLKQYSDHRILLTHMTPTGRAAAAIVYAPFGERVQSHYLPYDLPEFANKFFATFRPTFGIVMETEIWPNFLRAARVRRIPVFLVNARLSARSARGYQRLASLTREALNDCAGIAAQSKEHAKLFTKLGARDVQVFGNMKFDVTQPSDAGAKTDALLSRISKRLGEDRLVLCCASTREGEESLILRALVQRIKDNLWPDRLLLLIVPRHPQRFDEVTELAKNYKLKVARKSSEGPIASDVQVLIGDSMGEMAAYYCVSDLALIGGSLLPFGAQNMIEACATGCPVLLGPHTFNFPEAAALALEARAALSVANAEEALQRAYQLLIGEKRAPGERSAYPTPATRREMADAALRFASEHTGATRATMAWMSKLLTETNASNS